MTDAAIELPLSPQALASLDTRGIKTVETLGLRVDAAPSLSHVCAVLEERLATNARCLVTFVNPSSVSFAERSPEFRSLLSQFDLVLPDGQGMVRAIELVHRIPAARVSFDSTSLALPVFELAQANEYDIYLIGGLPGVAERARDRIEEAFPSLQIAGVADGFGDIEAKARVICRLKPAIVIAAMGWRAQEAFLIHLTEMGWRGTGFTCGGYFDQLAGSLQYYPEWVDRANLRWLYRLYKEPRRLWRRYLFDYGRFAVRLTSALNPRVKKMIRNSIVNPSRLSALQETKLLDSPPEEGFDQLARLAMRMTHAPLALVSLVDADRQYLKSCIGGLGREPLKRSGPLSHSFCQYAVAAREPLIIEDAREHPILKNNPAVQDLGVIAYAGIPLITADGHALGTICVLDSKPHAWRDEDISSLQSIATALMTLISYRASASAGTRAADVPQDVVLPSESDNILKALAAYMEALDEYDDVLISPSNAKFFEQEAALQLKILAARAQLEELQADAARDASSQGSLGEALAKHLEAEKTRSHMSEDFAHLKASLAQVEEAVNQARIAEQRLRQEWRRSRSPMTE